MSADIVLRALAQIAAVSSAAILIVGALRKAIRRTAGARVAYWLWLAVPTSVIALWLPAPSHTGQSVAHALPSTLAGVIAPALSTTSAVARSGAYAAIALAAWAAGALLMAIWLVYRQRDFTRSLGCLTAGSDGVLRSDYISAPMLIGAWRPKVIVPGDFETRYPEEDRALMLAHERAHRERGDAMVNSIAAASLCLFWFNPLMYWAVGRFRFDQELACDAHVLARLETNRKRYADALLKAQLISESDLRVPVGCHWRSGHPLKERITMLKLASPGLPRRLCGIACNVALIASGMYAVSVGFAQTPARPALAAGGSTSSAASVEHKFSLDFKDADVRTILATIARKGDRNIVVSDQVHGRITLHLKNVTWEEAVNVVALSQDLDVRQSGDITVLSLSHGR